MIGRSIRSGRKAKLSALAVVAGLALSGCGSLHPGVAAVVGSDTISREQVDDVAAALCSANIEGAKARGQAAPEMASRGARQGALQVLLDTEISHQFGEARGVEANQQLVSQALAQNEQGLELLPESQRPAFREALREYAEGQLMLIEIGRQSLQDQGKTNVTDDQALAEGQRLRQKYVKSLDIEVDPRYGTFEQGTLKPGGTSMSVAQSDDARAGSKADPGTAFVSALPVSQRCT